MLILCNYMTKMQTKKSIKLRLRGPTLVFIDWANVHGWQRTLKRKIDLDAVQGELKTLDNVHDIRIYHGRDKHPSSRRFLERSLRHGLSVVTKEVKYLDDVDREGCTRISRKCDFDIEIALDVWRAVERGVTGFVFLSGDGDFAPLYEELVRRGKQVIVVYAHGHLGREVYALSGGIFRVAFLHLWPNAFLV